MWLDRWDKFGFRFYHRTWSTPPESNWQDYDHLAEFDYAKKHGPAGMVLWTGHLDLDTPEHMNNGPWWDWTVKAAKDRGLPVGLNITVGNPTWLLNRYRDQTQLGMPQFSGNWHRIGDHYNSNAGTISYAATTAKEEQLEMCREVLRRYCKDGNVTTILEPHGELSLGSHRIFLEHGPLADESFQTYLKRKYGNLAKLNQRWGMNHREWSDVKLPELASFAGWNVNDALDLKGLWKVKHEPLPEGVHYEQRHLNEAKFMDRIDTRTIHPEWLRADFDDSDWPALTAPGHDALTHLDHRPAVYRRTINIDAEWRSQHRKLWLYVWDLNMATDDMLTVAVNDKQVGNDRLRFNFPHWGAYDVSDVLREGRNLIALRLPKGFLAYRVYLSSEPPKQYPNLGRELNARWVDFADWTSDVRVQAARRGMEMIREIDPHRQIVLMDPEREVDAVTKLALQYGGNLHNTGWMGVIWGDLMPALMRGARLPFSLEPGGAATNLREFKEMLGRYCTEGIQGIDYFIHIGEVMWKDDIRQHYEAQRNLLHATGTYHAPTAQVAALYSDRNYNLTSFPWGGDFETDLGGGYWRWNIRANLIGKYESDGLTPSSFGRGDASRYPVIIDTNTSMMDEKLVKEIESYVRAGGTFVTWAQSGRHTPTEKDAWPISRITGYKITAIDPHDQSGAPMRSRGIHPAKGQKVFTGDWTSRRANGLTLTPMANDVRNLMMWEDGSVAVGARRIGKGAIVHVGCKFAGARMFDRIGVNGWDDVARNRSKLLEAILDWKKISPVPARLKQSNNRVFLRHNISNNGLYNVWALWNRDSNHEAIAELQLEESVMASTGIELRDHSGVAFHGGQTTIRFAPGETRMFLTPRSRIEDAPEEWFRIQRDWWRGTNKPPQQTAQVAKAQWALNLTENWRFKVLDESEDGSPYASRETDDRGWPIVTLGVWGVTEHKNVTHAILRRRFEVPDSWQNGETALWLTSFFANTFQNRGRIWLDGKLIHDWNGFGIAGVNPENSLTPGSTHMIAVEIQSQGGVTGSRGSCWLGHFPKPNETIDLAGQWQSSNNMMSPGKRTPIPGPYHAMSLRREFEVPARHHGKNIVVQVDASGPLNGVILNGKIIQRIHRPHHHFGDRYDLNVTPWVRFDQANEIQLVTWSDASQGEIRRVSIGLFDRDVYP